jgi:hypothetical protein
MVDVASVYEVEWTERAYEDLTVKVRTEAVAVQLVDVSTQALDAPESPDGGRLGSLLWRRGLTPQCRAWLDTAEGIRIANQPREHSWDYVLIYKGRGSMRGGYQVIAVLTNGEIISGLNGVPSLDTPPT